MLNTPENERARQELLERLHVTLMGGWTRERSSEWPLVSTSIGSSSYYPDPGVLVRRSMGDQDGVDPDLAYSLLRPLTGMYSSRDYHAASVDRHYIIPAPGAACVRRVVRRWDLWVTPYPIRLILIVPVPRYIVDRGTGRTLMDPRAEIRLVAYAVGSQGGTSEALLFHGSFRLMHGCDTVRIFGLPLLLRAVGLPGDPPQPQPPLEDPIDPCAF